MATEQMRIPKYLLARQSWVAIALFVCGCISFTAAADTTNALTNPGFETALSGWTATGTGTITVKADVTRAHSGTNYLEVTCAVGQHPTVFAAPTPDTYVPVTTGEVLTFGGYVYRASGDGYARFMLIAYDRNKANPKYISPTPNNASGAAWMNLAGSYLVPSGVAFVRLYAEVYQNTISTTVRFDDAVLNGTLPALQAPAITWANPADIVYGTALSTAQLNASSVTPGTFAYAPAAGTTLNAAIGQTLSATFTPTDTTNYATATKTVTINVSKAASTITWANPADIAYGTPLSTAQLNASATVSGTFVYTPAAGTTLNAASGQTLSATFTPTDTTNYATATKTVTINVSKTASTITWVNPADIVYGTALSAAQLNASATVPGTFVYTPAAGSTLNAAIGQTLSATFTPTDTTTYATATKTATINVSKASATITWANPADVTYGTALSTAQLNASSATPGTFVYTPAAGTTLSAATGQILTATFTPTDATNYATATKTVAINVTKASATITWANPADIVYGTALSATQLKASATVPGTFVYAPAAGTTLNAGSAQTLTATFTPADATTYATATKTVAINVSKATATITWANPTGIVYGTALSATQLKASATVPGTFVYTPAAGTTLNAGSAQTLTATLTPTDATNYAMATKTVAINVSKATSSVIWATPAIISYGTALSTAQLNAGALMPGTFVYTPPQGTILNVGSKQTLRVAFTPTNPANYTTATGAVWITVNKNIPTISWAAMADISYGTALSGVQLNAVAPVPGSFVYSKAAGTVLKAGNGQAITATFTPADSVNYATSTKTLKINIIKAASTIVWATPADMIHGTALSATQLNATSTVPGNFTYTPTAGTILGAGSGQTLTANFKPTDTANYTSATKTLTINVTNGTSTNQLLLGIRYGDNGMDMPALKDLEAWQEKKNAVVLTFTAWCDQSGYMDSMFSQQMMNLWNNQNIPVVTWEAYLCADQTTPPDVEGRAANGEYDAYFTAWAGRMKAWLAGPDGVYGTGDDRRAYLRMPHEMNGNWYPWSPTAPGEQPWQYVAMWQRIASIFELQGIDSAHLQWMWIPNVSGPYPAESFYPGDAYVDWVGLDAYNFGTYSGGKWMTPEQRLDIMVSRLKVLTTKPIALTETGSSAYTSTGVNYAAKDQWIKDIFTYSSQNNIRMVMYFNKDVGADFTIFGGSEGNGTYTSGTATYNVFTGYKQAISPSWVISSDPSNPRLLTDGQFAGQF